MNNYYPFGMRFNQAPVVNKQDNNYLYNGKELQQFGLDWYDYGARFYDPQLGRFTGIDPIADKFPHVSTFNYAENEPINSIDLWGLQRLSLADKMWSDYEEESKNRWRFMGTESDSTSGATPLITSNSTSNNKEEGEGTANMDGGSEEESNYFDRWLSNEQPLANGRYSAYYGLGGKIGFDAGGYKAFAGIHLYTVQRDLNYKGIESKHHYSGLEAGWGLFKAGFKYDWKANEFSTEGALGPIKWSIGNFPNAYMGSYLYLFGGIGGEVELNFGKIIDHYLHMNDWMGLPKGTPKW